MSVAIPLPRKLTVEDVERLPAIELEEEPSSPLKVEDNPVMRTKLVVYCEGG